MLKSRDTQFDGGQLLHDIPRHRVKNIEQGFVGEASHLLVDGSDVMHNVARRDVELGLHRPCLVLGKRKGESLVDGPVAGGAMVNFDQVNQEVRMHTQAG